MYYQDFWKHFSKTQALLGFGLLAFLFIWGAYLGAQKEKLFLALLVGTAIGYTLTRSRFGFAGGVKRIYVRGEGSLTKALFLALAVTTLMYGTMHWSQALDGHVVAFAAEEGEAIIAGTQNVYIYNIATLIGSFIFGIGMILAGGCASGSLADFGEGEIRAAVALPFFILGSIPGEIARGAIDDTALGKIGPRVYLPDVFGYVGAFLVTLGALGGLYLLVRWYEHKRYQEGTYLSPKSDYEDFERPLANDPAAPVLVSAYHKLFVQRWSFATGALILSVVSMAWFAFNEKAWGVTTAFVKIGAWFFSLFGITFDSPHMASANEAVAEGILMDSGVVLDIGIVAGAVLAFLLAGRFSVKKPVDHKNTALFAFGGLLMGLGSRLGKGCNIGAFYSSLTNFSLSGWLFMITLALGAVFALKVFQGGRSCMVPARHRHPEDFK